MVLVLHHKEKKTYIEIPSSHQKSSRSQEFYRHFEARAVLQINIRNFTAELNALENTIQATFVRLDSIQVSG